MSLKNNGQNDMNKFFRDNINGEHHQITRCHLIPLMSAMAHHKFSPSIANHRGKLKIMLLYK